MTFSPSKQIISIKFYMTINTSKMALCILVIVNPPLSTSSFNPPSYFEAGSLYVALAGFRISALPSAFRSAEKAGVGHSSMTDSVSHSWSSSSFLCIQLLFFWNVVSNELCFSWTLFSVFVHVHPHACIYVCLYWWNNFRSQFSPSTMWETSVDLGGKFFFLYPLSQSSCWLLTDSKKKKKPFY